MNVNHSGIRRSIRRGRGPRGPLLPSEVPRWKSRSESFDQAVIDAYSPLDQRWSRELSHLDIAIDTIPRMQLSPGMYLPEEIVADGAVPLGRLIPAGIDRAGNPTRPCVVVFRRPIERRVGDRRELDLLLRHVLTLLVAVYLGIEPLDVDSDFDEDFL